jgi:hypothetical protein
MSPPAEYVPNLVNQVTYFRRSYGEQVTGSQAPNCSNSKAVGEPQPTALPSSPYVPCSRTASVELSKPGSEASAAALHPSSQAASKGTPPSPTRGSIAPALDAIYRCLLGLCTAPTHMQKIAPTGDVCRGKVGVADNGDGVSASETYSRAARWPVTDNTKLRFLIC